MRPEWRGTISTQSRDRIKDLASRLRIPESRALDILLDETQRDVVKAIDKTTMAMRGAASLGLLLLYSATSLAALVIFH